MTKELLTRLESLINSVLLLDPDVINELDKLSGQIISLEFINTGLIVYIFPGTEGIRLEDSCDESINVRIRGTPSDMLAYLIAVNDEANGLVGNLEIIGDVGLAQKLQVIMKNVDVDWEEHLSHWVGDTMAHKIGNMLRSSSKYAREVKRTLALDISEYLRYEKEVLPVQSEVDTFVRQVDELRNDIDRLRARVNKLTKQQQII